ncbi:MAG: aminodeoxychorismate lyase, partial [Actinomycetia bacterium]|nr:aminodeoxychorismate lyase [Actinomycetes bacterium]
MTASMAPHPLPPPSPERRRPSRVRPLLVVVVLFGLLVGGVWVGMRLLGDTLSDSLGGLGSAADYPGPGSGEVVVEIAPGDTASAIGASLENADVVASAQAFVDAAVADDRSLGIQPGFYSMLMQMSADGSLERLLDP